MLIISRKLVNFSAIEDKNKKAKQESQRGEKHRKCLAHGRLPSYNINLTSTLQKKKMRSTFRLLSSEQRTDSPGKFPKQTPHVPLCRHRVIRETAEGLDEPCHFTAKCEQLAHCRRWNPDVWQSPVEGLSLVKHTCQKSSPGQQVIKKISAALEPSYGWYHAYLTANSSVFTKQ